MLNSDWLMVNHLQLSAACLFETDLHLEIFMIFKCAPNGNDII